MPSAWMPRGVAPMAEAACPAAPMAMAVHPAAPLLQVEGLSIGYRDAFGRMSLAVRELGFTLAAGESIGLVGESGSGKSTVARALLGHYRGAGERTAGRILIRGQALDERDPASLARLRGIDIAFVPQNPLSSLTYHLSVGAQLVEILRTRAGLDAATARERALALMAQTRLPDPETLFDRYPHQLSGGQRQRVVIACALACQPRLLVLDEPTTALDKSTEVQVLGLVTELRRSLGVGLVLVTHDLNVVARMCDSVLVMKDGVCVEQGATAATFASPATDYTRELVGSVLRLDADPPQDRARHDQPALVAVSGLGHRYQAGGWWRRASRPSAPALQGVDLGLRPGEVLGVIGESGSGKSTLGGALAGLIAPSEGGMRFQGDALPGGASARSREQRRRIQMVFQDPLSSLNPRQRVGTAIARPMQVFFGMSHRQAWDRAAALLDELGLEARFLERYPRQLSGGQQQRVAIARALAADPELIICDEFTSALDATVQGQVIDRLMQVQARRALALVVITHDLGVVWRMAHRVLVLREGRVHEQGLTADVFARPASDYTRLLLAAATSASRPQSDPPGDQSASLGKESLS